MFTESLFYDLFYNRYDKYKTIFYRMEDHINYLNRKQEENAWKILLYKHIFVKYT